MLTYISVFLTFSKTIMDSDMKKNATLLILVLALLLSSCDKSDDTTSPNNTQQVNLTISNTQLPSNLSVTYKAVSTGDGKITQLTYLDDKGVTQTVSNPTLPWSMTLSMTSNDYVSMTAAGTISKGSLTITVDGIGTGSTFNLEDSKSIN